MSTDQEIVESIRGRMLRIDCPAIYDIKQAILGIADWIETREKEEADEP